MGYEMYRMLALRKMPKIPVKKSKRLKKQEMNVEPETNEQIKKYMDGNFKSHFYYMYSVVISNFPNHIQL